MTHDFNVILSNSGAAINGEPLVLPAGVEPHDAVWQHLQFAAAEAAQTITVEIVDETQGSTRLVAVAADGTLMDVAPSPIPPAARPLPAVPAAHRSTLEAVFDATLQGRHDDAIRQADTVLSQLSTEAGEDHPATLVVAQIRADLAWLTGNVAYAFSAWLWIADAWARHLPPGARAIGVAARNATAAWHHLPMHEAAPAAQDLLTLLERVAPAPATNRTLLGVTRRLAAADGATATPDTSHR